MKNSYLALICGVLLFIVLSMAWCKPRPGTQAAGPASPAPSTSVAASASPIVTVASPSSTASAVPSPTLPPSPTPTAELRKAAEKVAPAIILVSVFDASGKLLRTGTGFFVSEDGKFVASRSLVEGGVNAIASTTDKKIHNVTGVLAESPDLDIAVLKAEAKQVHSLPLNNVTTPETGARVAVVASPLGRRAGTSSETRITAKHSDEKGEWFDLESSAATDMNGSPVVNENGVIVGIITDDHGKTPAASRVLSSNSLHSFLSKIEPDASPKWAAAPPTPTPSPKMRKGKILFNPAPAFPSNMRGPVVIKGIGSYRVLFDTTGRAKNVQMLRSTGVPALDQAAMSALAQWKSDPGTEWSVVVPVNFQPRSQP